MVRCPRCGYENEATDIYCRNCTYPLQDPKTNFSTKRQRDKSWNIGTGKKIIIVLGIIVIAFLLFTVIHNVTQPSPQSSLNVVTGQDSGYEASSNPYKVHIICNGSWYGEMGQADHPSTLSGQGDKLITIDCASWDDVSVKVTKTGSAPLTVQLLRNGKVIAENSTDASQGTITLTN